MSGFIRKSACHGSRPSHLESIRHLQRPVQLSRLLKERAVLRCVVAPYGYGKTSLLLEYAEIMFSFSHVFWVNGQSPCFMRDLDDECIASSCFDCDKDAALVVIDDLPYLDAGRCEGFSREVDRLLEKGCEVAYVGEITLIELLDADVKRIANAYGVNEIHRMA